MRFSDVDYIDYTFSNLATEWGLVPSTKIIGRRDAVEWFSVFLFLKDGRQIRVGTFYGDGAVSNGLPGFVLGDDLVDYSGKQGEDSLAFVRYLCRFLRVDLGKEILPETQMDCNSCGRSISKYSKHCLYCGKELNARTSTLK